MILVNCPHCQQLIEIMELNCLIFRCGEFKQNGQPIPPHLSKQDCERLIEMNLIYGCGKPFILRQEEKEKETIWVAIVCDYI